MRKAQKLVEKDGVKFLTGVALSSEALAVSAKCPEWKVIFMSTINGAGRPHREGASIATSSA